MSQSGLFCRIPAPFVFKLTSVAQLGLVSGVGARPLAPLGACWCPLVFSTSSSIFRPSLLVPWVHSGCGSGLLLFDFPLHLRVLCLDFL